MVLSENYVLFEARVDFTRSDESTSCTIIRTFLGLSIYRFAMLSSTGQAGLRLTPREPYLGIPYLGTIIAIRRAEGRAADHERLLKLR
jgi:hypothetical protein